MRRAEAQLARAAEVAEAKKKVQKRMAKKLEGKLSGKQLERFMGLFKTAHRAHLAALFDERVDENFLLQMKLQLTQTEMDMYLAEWEASEEHETATNQLVERFRGIAQRAVRAHAELCRES